jgi:hypothetical protein
MMAWFRSIKDPAFHLAVVVLLGVLILTMRGSATDSSHSSGHPADCHACSTIPAGATAKFEAFLVKSGSMEPR